MVQQLPPPRPATEQDKNDLLIPLASGVQELLFAPVNPFNDRPGFVAGPTPQTGLGQAVQGITRLNCRLWAARDKSGFSPRVNQYNGEVCGPYLDDLGEEPDPGFVDLPFTGGQCPGANYQIDWSWSAGSFNSGPQQVQRSGPLSFSSAGTGSLDCGSSGARYNQYTLIDGTGQSPVSLLAGCGANLNNLTVTRLGGGADNCGNPPAIVQPPGTVTPVTPIVPTIDIDLPGVGPITVNVDLDPTGNIIIVAPDIGAEVTIAPDLDIDLGGGDGGGGDPGDPTDPGDPGDPEGTGSGGGAEGEAPPGSELVGLLVTVTEAPGDANKFANNPKQPFRGIGYVRMGFPGRLGLDISGGTVISPQFFHAQQRGLTNWAVDANTGFNLTVQPYYRDIET